MISEKVELDDGETEDDEDTEDEETSEEEEEEEEEAAPSNNDNVPALTLITVPDASTQPTQVDSLLSMPPCPTGCPPASVRRAASGASTRGYS